MLSVFDIFKIGIGPSSSHTVGPMVAAKSFVENLQARGQLSSSAFLVCDLYGSLALTGVGHGTGRAVLYGLSGERPDTITDKLIRELPQQIEQDHRIRLNGRHEIAFDPDIDIRYRDKFLPEHPNAMRLMARDAHGAIILEEVYYSIGGGFIATDDTLTEALNNPGNDVAVPHPFDSAQALLDCCKANNSTIATIVMTNERAMRDDADILSGIDAILNTMRDSITRGSQTQGTLPGEINLKRRAANKVNDLNSQSSTANPMQVMDWVNAFALAVSEENAAGHRIVTAPTNGAAGIIPATIAYYERFCDGATQQGCRDFLLTSAAIGMLFKQKASISGAEVGCQGEVGVACSMAAAGLCAVLGGTVAQVENAAEIGMEHNLGLTCDPVAGLVQVPCIERNAMGAIKAINACRLALGGDGSHMIALDQVIKTMKDTGADMQSKYKETAQGGLAVNWVDC